VKISWLSEFKVWSALDRGETVTPLPPPGTKAAEYLHQATKLDGALKAAPSPFQSPQGLHEHIMTRLRAADRDLTAITTRHHWPRVLGLATAIGLMAGLLWIAEVGNQRQNLPSRTPLSAEIVMESVNFVPAADLSPSLLGPLTEEMDHVGQDVLSAANRLLASIP